MNWTIGLWKQRKKRIKMRNKFDWSKTIKLEVNEGEKSLINYENKYNSFNNHIKKITLFFEIDKETEYDKDNNNNIIVNNNLSNEDLPQNIILTYKQLNNLDYKMAIIKEKRSFSILLVFVKGKSIKIIYIISFYPSNTKY